MAAVSTASAAPGPTGDPASFPAARRGHTPTDFVFGAYLVGNTAVVLWHAHESAAWPYLLAANALAALLIVLLARAPLTPLVRFLSGGYAIVLTMAFYTQLGILATDTGRLHDPLVQHWEARLFGGPVSVTWHQRMPNALLSTVLHLCYGSYYWMVIASPVFLFARRSRESYERGGFVLTLVFYLCYLVFALFPVAGPRFYYGVASGPAAEVAAARLVHAVLAGGSAYGTAFPSSHVAAAWCAVFILWKDARWAALLLAPIALGVALGTVYGQFHYAVDAATGAAVGVLVCAVADPLRRALRRGSPT